MTDAVTQRSWNEFWGDLLLLRCHADDPDRWSGRERRAEALFRALGLNCGARILDLGCGDGVLSICLARMGARVVAVDRTGPLLEAARREEGAEAVDFVLGDLREVTFPPQSFDVVLMLELVGLMSARDDTKLIQGAHTWLAPDGQIVVDCPVGRGSAEGRSSKQLSDGLLELRWTYDSRTRYLHVVPTFRLAEGATIQLYDPYDNSRPDHVGVLRYLYPSRELHRILAEGGFTVREAEHHWGEGYRLLIGQASRASCRECPRPAEGGQE